MVLMVRASTTQEAGVLNRTAHSGTAPHRTAQRAQTVWGSADGDTVPAIALQAGLSALRVRAWIQRFDRVGLAGLRDAPRSGRPRRHDGTGRSTIVALALTKPRRLGLPYVLWPPGRLQRARQEHHGRYVTPATIWLPRIGARIDIPMSGKRRSNFGKESLRSREGRIVDPLTDVAISI
jgi:transposase